MLPTSPKFFKTATSWRAWLEKNHAEADEVWVGLRKKGSGLPSVTYKEAVDAALCFGWIDGQAKSIDETSYGQRFTPRRKRSIWSAVNIARVAELTRLGLMHSAGLAAFEGRDPKRVNQYSFEQSDVRFADSDERRLRADKAAWRFFAAQTPSYRRQATWWVVSAKKAETRERRLATLIEDSAAERPIAPLRWTKPQKA